MIEEFLEYLRLIGSPEGQERTRKWLKKLPYPHFEQSDDPNYLIKIDQNGTRTEGRFVNRQFVPRSK